MWSRDIKPVLPAGPRDRGGPGCGPIAITPTPAHAAFGGYKQSGIGRETHRMMLDHYQQTKNMLVSYEPKEAGLLLIAGRRVQADRRTRRRKNFK